MYLAQIIFALHLVGLHFCLSQGWEQHGRKNANNSNHNKEFDERKGMRFVDIPFHNEILDFTFFPSFISSFHTFFISIKNWAMVN